MDFSLSVNMSGFCSDSHIIIQYVLNAAKYPNFVNEICRHKIYANTPSVHQANSCVCNIRTKT